jgi:hypothetical protein
VRADLLGGRIWASAPGKPAQLWLDKALLTIQPEAERLKLEGSGLALGGALLQVSAESDVGLKQARAQFRFKHADLSLLSLPKGLSVSAGTLEGQLSVDAGPGLPGIWPGLRLEGNGRLEDGALRWQDRPAVEQASARWVLKDQRLQVSAVQALAAEGKWKGEFSLDLGAQQVLAQASSAALDLAPLAQLAGAPEGLSLSGKVAADFHASGSLSATALSLELHSKEAQWRTQALNDLQLRWDRAGDGQQNVDARLGWSDGLVQVNGLLDAQGRHQGKVDVDGLRADWLQPWVGAALAGRVQGQGHWNGGPQGLTWEAKVSTTQLTVGSLDLKKVALQGWGDSKAVHARIEGDALGWKGLNAELDLRQGLKDDWALKTAKLFVGSKLLATAEGRLQGKGKDLRADWKANIGPWAVAELPGADAFKGLSGQAQASGQWTWAAGALSGSAKLSVADLRRGAVSGPLTASLLWQGGQTLAKSVDFRHGELKGEGQTGPYEFKGQIKDADLGSWASLLGSPLPVSGRASGSLAWSEASSTQVLNWDLNVVQGSLTGVDFETFRHRGSWTRKGGAAGRLDLEDIELLQKAGGRVSGDLGLPMDASPWKGDLFFQSLVVGPGPWNGRLHLDQAKDTQFGRQARLSALALGSQSLPDLLFQAQALDPGLGDWHLSWGPELKAEGRGGQWHSAKASSLDLDRWATVLRLAGHPGLPTLKGTLNGQAFSGPSGLSFSAKLDDLVFDTWNFGPGSVDGSAQGGKFSIGTLALGGAGPRLKLSQASLGSSGSTWDFQGDLFAQDLPYSLFTLSGQGHLKAESKGSNGKLNSDWAWFQAGQRRFEGLKLDLGWDGSGNWTLAPRQGKAFKAAGKLADGNFSLSSLESKEGRGSASLKGEVLASGALNWDGQASGYPVEELTGVLGWAQEWKGAAYGNLSVRGTTTTPRTIVSIKVEDGSVQGVAFDLAQATVHVEEGWVKLAPLGPIRISRRQAYLMEVSGLVPLDDDHGKPKGPLEVQAHLKEGGLGFFASLPGITAAEGPLQLDLSFSGDRSDPTVNGSLRVTGGSITPAWLLTGLEKVDLFAQIQDGQVQLQQAQARVVDDGPLLRLELAAKDQPAFVLERWQPERFNLRLRSSASGLPVRSTAQLRFLDGSIHPDLLLGGGWLDPAVSGSLSFDKGSLEKALVTWPPKFSPPLPKVEEGGEPGFLDRIEWNLGMAARKDVMLRTDVAQVFVDTGEEGLHLQGALPHRSLEGRLQVIKGSIDYLLTTFDMAADRPSWVEFRGEDAPQLEFNGTKRVRDALLNGEVQRRDAEVRLHAFGPLGQIEMSLSSDDPSLTKDQLASLAGFGIDSSDQRNQGGFARLLGKAPASVLTRFARRSGLVDVVDVRLPGVEEALAGNGQAQGLSGPSQTAADSSPTSKALVEFSAGKWFTENLFVGGNMQVNEKRDAKGSSMDLPIGAKMEYQLKNKALVTAQHNVAIDGQTDQRVMLERSSSFSNYNPKQRRWGQAPAVEPTPQASPVKTETPVAKAPSQP